MAHHFFNTSSIEPLILLTPKTVLIVDMPYETHDNCFLNTREEMGKNVHRQLNLYFYFDSLD